MTLPCSSALPALLIVEKSTSGEREGAELLNEVDGLRMADSGLSRISNL